MAQVKTFSACLTSLFSFLRAVSLLRGGQGLQKHALPCPDGGGISLETSRLSEPGSAEGPVALVFQP